MKNIIVLLIMLLVCSTQGVAQTGSANSGINSAAAVDAIYSNLNVIRGSIRDIKTKIRRNRFL